MQLSKLPRIDVEKKRNKEGLARLSSGRSPLNKKLQNKCITHQGPRETPMICTLDYAISEDPSSLKSAIPCNMSVCPPKVKLQSSEAINKTMPLLMARSQQQQIRVMQGRVSFETDLGRFDGRICLCLCCRIPAFDGHVEGRRRALGGRGAQLLGRLAAQKQTS
mmetsp:Transcript_58454/g.123991  ORF Transcript_58454/g.123991 Transcript_58454/m.123991 type:complete len:164 (-) Transcript_58454:821-1312(-)